MFRYFCIIIIKTLIKELTEKNKPSQVTENSHKRIFFFLLKSIYIHTHTDFLIFMFLYFVIYLLFYLSSRFTCYYFKINVFLLLSSLFIGKQISNFND